MGFLEDREFSDVPSIDEYYTGKTIFITGGSDALLFRRTKIVCPQCQSFRRLPYHLTGTQKCKHCYLAAVKGFMGKVLIEKLLYSCPDLDRIYILVRSKKGFKSEDRLAQIYSSLCFDRLRKERPTIFDSKVFIVAGDVVEPGLGLSEEDRTLLVNRVNIIFHVAASVRFDDPLSYAAKMNIGGTKEIVDLAKDIRNLSCLLHVSTSYSNTNREVIEEVIYPPHADWRDTLDLCEKTDEHTLRVLTAKYLGELPNTYVFTKQLAEHVVNEQKGLMPIVIFRPSIVISSLDEPTPGWIENFNGPAGLMVASGKGIMRSVYSYPDLVPDYIPVDITIKCMIVAGWMRGTKRMEPSDDIPIYNCCSGKLNAMSVGGMTDLAKMVYPTMPLDGMLWSVGGDLTSCKYKHYIKVILLHLLPAIFVDTILRIAGHKPLLVKIQRRIYIANLALEYYLTKQWTFDNKNSLLLQSKIKAEDQEKFFFNLSPDIAQYMFYSLRGGRRYLLREKDEDLPKAKVHFKRMAVLDIVVRYTFYFYLFWWLIHTNIVQNFLTNAWEMLS